MNNPKARSCGWMGLALMLLCGARVAQAEDRDRAKVLVDQGARLFDQGKFQEALDRFNEAHDLYATPKIYFNIAEALRSLDRKVDAAEAFDKFLVGTATDVSAASNAKRDLALKALGELKSDVCKLNLEVSPESVAAVIDIDSGTRVAHPGTVYVFRGRHTLQASAAGYAPDSQAVEAGEKDLRVAFALRPLGTSTPPVALAPGAGGQATVKPPDVIAPEESKAPPIVLAPAAGQPPPPEAKPEWSPSGAPPSGGTESKTAPAVSHVPSYVAFAVAGLAAVGGVAMGVKALGEYNSTPQGASLKGDDQIADVLWAGAALAAATGGVLWYFARPSTAGSGGEVGVGGHF